MSHERKYQVQPKRPVWQKVAIGVLLLALCILVLGSMLS